MEGPSPARDCPALVNSSKLWELKGLKDVGILTQQQFERQVEHTLTEPGTPSEAPPMKKRIHASLLRTAESVPLPSKQKSLFASGFWKEKTTQEGEVLLINGDARPISSPPVTHKCRFAPCDYRHQFKCSLALHEKNIPSGQKDADLFKKQWHLLLILRREIRVQHLLSLTVLSSGLISSLLA